MECASDHDVIEKTKKRTQMRNNHLYDWVQLVKACKVQKPFKVVVITVNDFFDFAKLKSKKGLFTVKKLDDSGDNLLWEPIKWLQYDKNSVGKINFKKNLDREPPVKLSLISKEALPISVEKKKDLMDMIDLIDESFKEFYIKIKTVNDVSASTDPDLDADNPDEEGSEVL
ncbi:unnamed protein product [Euphydryas editha]|uniref:Uncharacterized protein n=1 Tax=Euphydryas editha TaxID=104508 RepID=A0AAU9TLT4_EUPED|nr:unnamed protein product [Euphydryas editha]